MENKTNDKTDTDVNTPEILDYDSVVNAMQFVECEDAIEDFLIINEGIVTLETALYMSAAAFPDFDVGAAAGLIKCMRENLSKRIDEEIRISSM